MVRRLRFGTQLDSRPIATARRTDDPGRALTPEQVAGYLAKYATKSASDSGPGHNSHGRRIRSTVTDLAHRAMLADLASGASTRPYRLLGKWVHMLGFRGHFATKSRRYAITLGAIRRSRRRAQAKLAEANREGRPIDLAAMEADLLADDEAETTLVIGHWQYAGAGWNNEGERVLAIAAAARAREYAQEKAEQKKARRNSGGERT